MLLREKSYIDFATIVDISTEDALIRAQEHLQFLNDPSNVKLSMLQISIEADFARLHRMHCIDMHRLFPQRHSFAPAVTAVNIKCLRGYLRRRNLQAEKLDGMKYTWRSCCEQNVFCYSLVRFKGSHGKEGLMVITLPLAPKHRSSDVPPEEELFYRRGGDLFMSGAL